MTLSGFHRSARHAAPPTSPARLEGLAARHSVLSPMLVGAVFSIAAWLRIPSIARDTLWAEDGRDFLQTAMNQGPMSSLFRPYAGYLHTIPRIASSLIVQFVPVPQYAYAMTAASCIAAGCAAGVVYVCAQPVVHWVPARIVLAGITVLAPLEPREVLGNATNLHSILLWMLFWMLLFRPKNRTGSITFGVVALLAALTEIQSVFLLPLLLYKLRDRRRWPLRAGFVVGVAAQLVVTVIWPRGANRNPAVGLPSIAYGYLINSVVPLWLPQKLIGPALAAGGITLAILLALPLLAAAIFAFVRGSTIQRVAVSGLIVGSVVVYSASVMENPQRFYDYALYTHAQLETVWLARYGVVPSMMLSALFVVAFSTRGRTGAARLPNSSRVTRRIAPRAAVLGAVMALLLIQFVPQATRRSDGPAWLPQVDASAKACATQPDSRRDQLRETIGWKVTIDCGVLEQY